MAVRCSSFSLRRHPILAVFVAAVVFWVAAAPAGGADLHESRKELQEIQRRIAHTTEVLHRKRRQEHSLTAELKSVSHDLSQLHRRIAGHTKRSQQLDREIAGKRTEIAKTQADLDALKGKVRQRLTALYKEGAAGLFGVLFSSVSPRRMADEFEYLGRIVRRDKTLLSTYRQQREDLEQKSKQLSAFRRNQQEMLADLNEDRRTLQQAVSLKKKLLAAVHRDKASLASRLGTLRQRARALEALIKKLELGGSRRYTADTRFASQKGHLPWPVSGPVKVRFGTRRHPELGTLYDSQGIEIAVSGQEPIAAVWQGKVVFADRFKGYGNLIIIDHGHSFYSLYAQASRLTCKVGDRVKRGETLAFSGFPGAGGVFFEIRHRGTPLDPTDWLAPR